MEHSMAFYLQNGSVDVAATVAVVLLFVQMTKGIIESIGQRFDPQFVVSTVHDSIIELYTVVLSWACVWFLWTNGPGFHSNVDYGASLLGVIVAVAAEFGIYSKVRGPVPATPNRKWLRRVMEMQGAPQTAQGAMVKAISDLQVENQGLRQTMDDLDHRIAQLSR
jgi:hypothetical protein